MTIPADQEQRNHILNDLDSNIVVEAAAGTGKTTSMVGRMVALLVKDKCKINTIAAVTFTKKSASELRERFHAELMRRARSTEASDTERERLREAVENIEQCFIGTIHSFCGRILRERPIEAGVDVAFEEIDEIADQRLQDEAWNLFVAEAYTKEDGILNELTDVGLQIGQLGEAFKRFVLYPDVDVWPSEKPDAIPFSAIAEALKVYVKHIRDIEHMLPSNAGSDKLSVEYRKLERAVRQRDLSNSLTLMDILEECKESPKLTQKYWGDYKEESKDERDRWDNFYASTILPALTQWRELRYEIIIRILQSAVVVYDKMRIGRGLLNFQDLLMKASEVLSDNPLVRDYFRKRFTHLLVDEFQDTDPVQAKLMMYLTAIDNSETQWDRCVPHPGSLFVVGDPKQSIYRFRRADIVTYNCVKEIIRNSGGEILTLSANFRTSPDILNWVNDEFTERFPNSATSHAPAYVPFDFGRQDGVKGDFHGVQRLDIPEDYSKKPYLSLEFEADSIVNTIADALKNDKTVTCSTKDILKDNNPQKVQPGDFLIVTRGKKNMSEYAKRLGALGIPHEVTGGTVLNETREIALLYALLNSVILPDDSVALVNLLRGELFGFSDRALFRYKQSFGRFKYTSPVPEELEEDDKILFADSFDRLKKYSRWLRHLPHISALERIVQDSGLLALSASREAGNVRAGSLEKVIEIVRAEQHQIHDATGLADLIRKLSEGELDYDGMIAGQRPDSVVRIMNLHKVKGLEASIVFLADTKGERSHEVNLHVDRSEASLTQGFMNIRGESGTFTAGPLLAHPHDWELAQNTEEPFQNAETTRLLYVAATRAGASLVISSLVGSNRKHFWHIFDEALRAQSPLRPPQIASAVIQETVDCDITEFKFSIDEQSNGIGKLLNPTFARGGAKDLALSGSETPKSTSYGEHGTEWGTLLHDLFEVAMKHPEHDIRPLALTQLDQLGLLQSRLDEALDTIAKVMDSEIWARAESSEMVIPEAPFQFKDVQIEIPTIIRGVIDLVFKEGGGWVIVDYKTDHGAQENIEAYTQHYTPQLQAYAQAWEYCTGEKVVETGLYFTSKNLYVRCDGIL